MSTYGVTFWSGVDAAPEYDCHFEAEDLTRAEQYAAQFSKPGMQRYGVVWLKPNSLEYYPLKLEEFADRKS